MKPNTKKQKSGIIVGVLFFIGGFIIVFLNQYYKTSIETASSIIGGLGLFIYGMKVMSDGLQELAGDRMRKTLKFLTGNRIAGVFTGFSLTAIVQSSSAVTVLIVGFVNSGLMTLVQAAGVVLGANIGTTITGQLIAFKLEVLALPAIAIGSGMFIFGKTERIKLIGKISLGFGMLFFAIGLMSEPMKILRNNEEFRNLFVKFSENPFLGLLIGIILTFIVQSSSVTIAITMSLAASGLISFSGAIPIILGDNIGTTITAFLAGLGTTLAARRAAIVHTLFNLFGAIIVMIVLVPYTSLIFNITPGNVPLKGEDIPKFIEYSYNGEKVKPKICINNNYLDYNEKLHSQDKIFIIDKFGKFTQIDRTKLIGFVPYMMRHVANAHTIFNILNVLLWLPFINVLIWAAKKIYPGKEEELEGDFVKHLDVRMLQTPPIAIAQVEKETLRMFSITGDMLEIASNLCEKFDKKTMEKLVKLEKIVNMLENAISEYVYLLFDKSLTEYEREIINSCLNSIHEIERIGDHALSITESLEYGFKHDIDLSKTAHEELKKMFAVTIKMHKLCVKYFETEDYTLTSKIISCEDAVDSFKKRYRKRHIKRLNKKICNPGAGIIFVDIINYLERLADHINNVASIISDDKINVENKDKH